VFLVGAALMMSQSLCSSPEVRGCFELDDATCVRLVGDAIVRADRFDMEILSGHEQREWLKGPGKRAALAGLERAPRRNPCVPSENTVLLQTVAISSERRGPPCIRLESDRTRCSPE
jgi:hypothetical protein